MDNSNSLNDAQLVSNYVNGCEKSLEVLVNKHKFKLYNFIYSKVLNKDNAEDLFQETFIKVIKTLKRGVYNEEGKFLPWIMRIAHNLVIDFFRKNKRFPSFDKNEKYDIFQMIKDENPSIEKHLIDKQILKDLKKIIVKLPQDQKEVLNMRLYKEMSFKEISKTTGVSINTALGRMRYAIINLRKLIIENKITLSA